MSKLIRRLHLYFALFLTPWLLMYALSTLAMNHRSTLREWTGQAMPGWSLERTVSIPEPPAGLADKPRAEWMLAHLGMAGAYNINSVKTPPGTMVFTRQFAFNNRRLTYSPTANSVTIERQSFQWNFWLEKMHRRRGYQHTPLADDLWALSVDLVIAAIALWIVTGLWMWWELKRTRLLGAAFALSGIGLFTAFLLNG